MRIPWNDSRCISCLDRLPLTEEHIIPEAIGGALSCAFLCKPCNDRFGQIEAHLKSDPAIRIAIGHLSDRLPELWKTMVEGQPFLVTSNRGKERAKCVKGAIRVNATRLDDGSLLHPTEDAPEVVETTLRRRGAGQTEIDDALRKLATSPEDVRVSISPGIEVIKWSVREIEPELNGGLLDPLVALKIAYEYLALLFGTPVLESQLDSVREALVPGGQLPSECRVEDFRGREDLPFHGLAVERVQPHILVQIRLFGYLAYRVHFLGVRCPPETTRVAYTLDLVSGQEYRHLIDTSE